MSDAQRTTVQRHYDALVAEHGNELNVLLEAGEDLLVHPSHALRLAARVGMAQ